MEPTRLLACAIMSPRRAAHSSGRFRTEFGPVYYRGRLNSSVKLLVVGQDPSTDEILAQRNLVGSAGQRVQKLLSKIGITKSYVMFNTFLYGIKGQMDVAMNAGARLPDWHGTAGGTRSQRNGDNVMNWTSPL